MKNNFDWVNIFIGFSFAEVKIDLWGWVTWKMAKYIILGERCKEMGIK